MRFMGVALNGFCEANNGHRDCKAGEWRHSSPGAWWCQWGRAEGMCAGGLRNHVRVRVSAAQKVEVDILRQTRLDSWGIIGKGSHAFASPTRRFARAVRCLDVHSALKWFALLYRASAHPSLIPFLHLRVGEGDRLVYFLSLPDVDSLYTLGCASHARISFALSAYS
jgi:hypothetical protein